MRDTSNDLEKLRKKASRGDAEAMLELGLRYLAGNGTEQNAEIAVQWFRNAAEAGNVEAQRQLAVCCKQGIGLSTDIIAYEIWMEKLPLPETSRHSWSSESTMNRAITKRAPHGIPRRLSKVMLKGSFS